MTLIGIGPFWLYRSTFFHFSLSPKVKQADETLRRSYNRNCKTLSMNRAGKHHRGFYPSSCLRNCSLLSLNTLDTHILIYQSINLGGFFFLHFKLLQSLNSGRPNFRWITRDVPCCQLSLHQCLCFYQHFRHLCCKMLAHFTQFRLGNLCSCCFIGICPGKKHQMARAYTLFRFSTLTFSYFCCWPHQIGNMFSIYTELVFCCSCWEPLVLRDISKMSSETATPRHIKHRQRQSLHALSLCKFNF